MTRAVLACTILNKFYNHNMAKHKKIYLQKDKNGDYWMPIYGWNGDEFELVDRVLITSEHTIKWYAEHNQVEEV